MFMLHSGSSPSGGPDSGSRIVDCPRSLPVCKQTSSLLDTVGHTPLVRLRMPSEVTGCEILGKCEFMNPGGSVKDRIAKHIVEAAEASGRLRKGMTILEVTSGNTGIALALVGAVKGYAVEIVMPGTVSEERRHMLRRFGAKVTLLDSLLHIQDAVADAERRAATDSTLFLPRQFENPDNAAAHEIGTGQEILRQTGGVFDAFVMGVGTGGTVTGVGRAIRRAGSSAEVIAVEPAESAVLSGGAPGHHGIQGLADGFVPKLLDRNVLDGVECVRTADAKAMSALLAVEEGLLVGISAGANVAAAMEIAKRLGRGHRVVTVLCDRGERYLSLR